MALVNKEIKREERSWYIIKGKKRGLTVRTVEVLVYYTFLENYIDGY